MLLDAGKTADSPEGNDRKKNKGKCKSTVTATAKQGQRQEQCNYTANARAAAMINLTADSLQELQKEKQMQPRVFRLSSMRLFCSR